MNNHVRIKNDASRNAADNNQQDDINCLLITYIYLIGRIDLSRRKKSIDFINKNHSTAIQNKRKQHKKSVQRQQDFVTSFPHAAVRSFVILENTE